MSVTDNFYKEINNSVECTLKDGYEVYFYIPERYFETKSAIIYGEYVSLFGIFSYGIYNKDKLVGKLRNFYYPSTFISSPYTIEKKKGIKLSDDMDENDYRILKYKNKDKLVTNVNTPQNIQDVEELFKLFVITGNIPNNIDYRDIYKYFIDNMSLAGESYNINMQLFGIFQSELCRDMEDASKPFRLSKAKKNKQWNAYKSIPVIDVPKYISPYVSITSQGFDDSIIAASMMKDAKYSPLEPILTGNYKEEK